MTVRSSVVPGMASMIAPVSQARPIFVASGEGAGPAWMSVKAGEAGAFVFLPRGLPHSFLGVSEPPARVLVLLIPGGLEQIFLETGEALQTVLRAHGVETVGPPLTG
jgi:hypothetical protein